MTETPPTGVRRVLLDSGYAFSAFLLTLETQVARGFAQLERVRLRSMQGREAPTPEYLPAPRDARLWTRLLTPLRDPQSWLDVLGAVVGLVTAVFAFTLASLIGLGEGRDTESLLLLGMGAFALVTLPLAMRLAAVCHASLADVLLTTRAELQVEVRRMAGSRDAAHLAEADSLRRLERDLHDGPQQRLVRLTMDLGRALSRGIAPPLLVDRGLPAPVPAAGGDGRLLRRLGGAHQRGQAQRRLPRRALPGR